jgi:hypothetical protein
VDILKFPRGVQPSDFGVCGIYGETHCSYLILLEIMEIFGVKAIRILAY